MNPPADPNRDPHRDAHQAFEERPMEPPAHAVPPPFGTPWWATGPWVLQRPLIPLGEGVFEHVANVREEFGEFYLFGRGGCNVHRAPGEGQPRKARNRGESERAPPGRDDGDRARGGYARFSLLGWERKRKRDEEERKR